MMTEKILVNAPIQVVSVDPGQSGAVARIGRGRFEVLRDFKDLRSIALAIADLSVGCDVGVIEKVGAMPGQGVCSMFSFGRSTGTAFGALFLALAKMAPLLEVTPQRWQIFFRQEMGVDKSVPFDSRLVATRLFPSFALPYLTRKLDHNSGDAILLAAFVLWQYTENPSLDFLTSLTAVSSKNGSRPFVAPGQRGRKKRKGECGQSPTKYRSSPKTSKEEIVLPNTLPKNLGDTQEAS